MAPPPSDAALRWVADSVGTPTVSWTRELLGGTHARTDIVSGADGTQLVLRRFPQGDVAVHREARVLRTLDGLDGLAPQLLATDPDGAATGAPSIVTTLMQGGPCVTPSDPAAFATQLGRSLALVHAHPVGSGLKDVLKAPAEYPFLHPPLLERWDRLAAGSRVLTHSDFWSGNTLWRDGQLTGVVDWSGAGLAPRGFDVSWARLDLVLLQDAALADTFTRGYRAASGVDVPDLDVWDLYAATNAEPYVETWAPNYQQLGRSDLGPASLRRRLDQWLARLREVGLA